MLMDAFNKWKRHTRVPYDDEEDMFKLFYNHHYAGKNPFELLSELAYEIYELQVCMEGLVEERDEV